MLPALLALRRGRRPRLRSWQVDSCFAVLLVAAMVADAQNRVLVHGQRANDPWMYVLIVAMALPYLVHRRWPMAALIATSAVICGYSWAAYGPFPGLDAFVLLFGISLHSDRRRSAIAAAATVATMAFALAAQPAGVPDESTVLSTFSVTAVAWLAGENLRHRRARWAALEERATLIEREREERTRQAVAEERLRIARELHDMVAHSMSVIAVQSGVGNHVIDANPAEARRALAAIETTSRDVLTELRRLLGVLRRESDDGDPRAALEPAPGLGDLPALVRQVGDAGLLATLCVEGDAPEVPAAVAISVYRIVQEALTNVLKHGGPEAVVTVRHGDGAVAIQVVDNGRRTADGLGGLGEPGPAGHGLIGMRERVAVFGGEFEAGRRPGGGFQVSAVLPLGLPSAVTVPR